MPFVTKNPRHYFPALAEDSTEALHVGLFLSGSFTQQRRDDLAALGAAIRQSRRPIRCLWLRFKGATDESLLAAVRAFGTALEGATNVQSIVFEGRVATAHVAGLAGFFGSSQLRGVQFRRTDVDVSTFTTLRPFFLNAASLRVLDLSSNPGVDDACLGETLDALLEGGTRLETLNVGETNLDAVVEERSGITSAGVASIASFVSNSELSRTGHVICTFLVMPSSHPQCFLVFDTSCQAPPSRASPSASKTSTTWASASSPSLSDANPAQFVASTSPAPSATAASVSSPRPSRRTPRCERSRWGVTRV